MNSYFHFGINNGKRREKLEQHSVLKNKVEVLIAMECNV
jgi:hypothetical protein